MDGIKETIAVALARFQDDSDALLSLRLALAVRRQARHRTLRRVYRALERRLSQALGSRRIREAYGGGRGMTPSSTKRASVPPETDESGLLRMAYARAVRRWQEEQQLGAVPQNAQEPSGIRTLNWHPLDRLVRRGPAHLPSDEVAGHGRLRGAG